jgi:hypothetical protein
VAEQKPLVLINGETQQLPVGDTVTGIVGVSAPVARYWRMFNMSCADAFDLGAAEIEFRDINGTKIAGTVTSSTIVGGFPATNADDGNSATEWVAASNTAAWFEIDFGVGLENSVHSIYYMTRDTGAADQGVDNFTLEFSIDGTNWVNLGTMSKAVPWATGLETHIFPVSEMYWAGGKPGVDGIDAPPASITISPGWELILDQNFATTAITTTAQEVLTDLTQYDEIYIHSEITSGGSQLRYQFSPDGGTTWRTDQYSRLYTGISSDNYDNSDQPYFAAVDGGANNAGFATIKNHGTALTHTSKHGMWSSGATVFKVDGWQDRFEIANAIRFFAASTTISAGRLIITGKKSTGAGTGATGAAGADGAAGTNGTNGAVGADGVAVVGSNNLTNDGTITTSSSAFATKGAIVTPLFDILLKSLEVFMSTSPTQTIDISVAELTSPNPGNIASIIHPLGTMSAVNPTNTQSFVFPTPLVLQAGVAYAIMFVRTDGTATSACQVSYPGTGGLHDIAGLWETELTAGIRYATVAPAVSDNVYAALGAPCQMRLNVERNIGWIKPGGTANQVLTKIDGTDFNHEWSNSFYDVSSGFEATPTTSQILEKIMIARTLVFPANFVGSVGNIDTNPTASFAIDVQDDGVSIGTITIAIGGGFTFVTAGGTAQTVAVGSVLSFVGPVTADTTAASAIWTLLGSAS